MDKSTNTAMVQLGNSSKAQLKKEAAQWVVRAKKDSKNWNKAFSQQRTNNNA